MGAPKLTHLFKESDSSQTGVQEKARLQQLVKKLQDQLKDPKEAKKAALIIEKLLHSK